MNINDAPQYIQELLSEVSLQLQKPLTSNLVGIYLYGSLAMGGYNPQKSDIDILVVIKNNLTRDGRNKIVNNVLKLSDKVSGGGLELTVVTLAAMKDFRYPTPVELHLPAGLKENFLTSEVDLTGEVLDEGIAINIAITKQRGFCLFGVPIEEIFPNISREYILRAAIHDFRWSYNNVMKGENNGKCWVPSYAVLNSCRILAYIKDGLLTSKEEGGRWGINYLPTEFSPVISAASSEYNKSDKKNLVDSVLLKKFVSYTSETIKRTAQVKSDYL